VQKGSVTKMDEQRKRKVLRVAERLNRTDHIAFMSNTMSEVRYDQQEYSKRVEEAIKMGASNFQTSFPRNESLVDSIRKFARDIIPSFK
jgi:hypothetical protein